MGLVDGSESGAVDDVSGNRIISACRQAMIREHLWIFRLPHNPLLLCSLEEPECEISGVLGVLESQEGQERVVLEPVQARISFPEP